MKQYYQCRLERPMTGSVHVMSQTVAWIEARGAKIGVRVELLPDKEVWTVAQVYGHSLSEDVLKENQRLNRHSLPSIEPMT